MVRVASSAAGVYAYTRPLAGLNGIVVTNMDNVAATADLTLSSTSAPPSVEGVVDGRGYVATDLYNNVTTPIVFTSGTATLSVTIPPLGSRVFVLADSAKTLILPSLTDVKADGGDLTPKEIALEQNFPNPFNPSTTIRFQLPSVSRVNLQVFDLLGRQVASIIDGQLGTGVHEIAWDGRNTAGSQVGSGVYFYRLTVNGGAGQGAVQMKKMLLLK
jgi:hypothetical protein